MEDNVTHNVIELLSRNERLALSSLNKMQHKRNQNEIEMLRPITPSEVIGRRCVIYVESDEFGLLVNEEGNILSSFRIHDTDGEKKWYLRQGRTNGVVIDERYSSHPVSHEYVNIYRPINGSSSYKMLNTTVNVVYDKLPRFTVDIVTFAHILYEREVMPTLDVKEYLLEKIYNMDTNLLYSVYLMLTSDFNKASPYREENKKEYRKLILEELEGTVYI